MKIRQLQKKKQEEAAAAAAALASAAAISDSSSTISSHTRSADGHNNNSVGYNSSTKITPAQLRLQKDITELDIPRSIKLTFPNPADLFNFQLSICPQEGYYQSGTFRFTVEVNNNFPMEPPKIKCMDKIYHPNIDLSGNVCLNILREDWSPVLNLNSVLIGLNFLFLEPNPNDPLNKDAANVLSKNKALFTKNVKKSMRGGYIDDEYYDKII